MRFYQPAVEVVPGYGLPAIGTSVRGKREFGMAGNRPPDESPLPTPILRRRLSEEVGGRSGDYLLALGQFKF